MLYVIYYFLNNYMFYVINYFLNNYTLHVMLLFAKLIYVDELTLDMDQNR